MGWTEQPAKFPTRGAWRCCLLPCAVESPKQALECESLNDATAYLFCATDLHGLKNCAISAKAVPNSVIGGDQGQLWEDVQPTRTCAAWLFDKLRGKIAMRLFVGLTLIAADTGAQIIAGGGEEGAVGPAIAQDDVAKTQGIGAVGVDGR
jgi:hypothetical protein